MGGTGRTYYQVLGVARLASADEIRVAYRLLVARYHPDRHHGNPLLGLAAERAAELNQAHDVLSDPVRRAAYDAELAAAAGGRGGAVPAREARALAVLLRALSLVVAIGFLGRFVPLVWRTALRGLGVAAEVLGAPTGMLAGAVVALAAVTTFLVLRDRRGRRRS